MGTSASNNQAALEALEASSPGLISLLSPKFVRSLSQGEAHHYFTYFLCLQCIQIDPIARCVLQQQCSSGCDRPFDYVFLSLSPSNSSDAKCSLVVSWCIT